MRRASRPTSSSAVGRGPLGDLPCRGAIALQAMTGNIGVLGGHCGGCGSYGGTFPGMIQSGGPIVGPLPIAYTAAEYGYAATAQLPWLPYTDTGASPITWQYPVAPLGAGNFVDWRLPDAILLRDKVDSGQMSVQDYTAYLGQKVDTPPPNIHMAFLVSLVEQLNQNPDINTRIQALKKTRLRRHIR